MSATSAKRIGLNHHDSDSEETIFSAALRIRSAAERSAYLDAACRGAGELRQRIEALLEAHPALGDFLEQSIHGGPTDPQERSRLASVTDECPGARIGPYKLLQKLGEGGCGVVYMAEQEVPIRRRVALKVIKLGMDTKQVIARFEAERQALALMDHPNIARVLDAGATETGRPYFVMELVRGTKITDFSDQNRLSMRDRLELFMQVCQAVQHAHQKGIIHRDLKPSNILVTVQSPGAPGVPKVIDFGIAKAIEGRLTDRTLFTAFEQFLGTPAYMSPEQASMTALDVDTRSDIYSLGVLLYELLTGRTPFDARELLAAGIEEMRRTIREKEPLRPSTRLSTLLAAEQATTARFRQTELPKLVHLVRGDLDWIVMKAIEKDRARRYGTANALAMDVRRHLDNEPVVARPPSRLYEFQKAVRRHKVGFAAAAAVLLALTVGVVVSSLEAGRARRAERQTRRTAYVADMDLAHRALTEGDLGAAQVLLRRYWPGTREGDLRNWEWRRLANLAAGDPHFSLVAHSTTVWSVRFIDDHTLLTAGVADWRTIVWNFRERRPSIVITNGGGGGGVSEVMALAPRRNVMFYRVAWSSAPRVTSVDLQTGQESESLEAGAAVNSLDVSSDQNLLAVAATNQVRLWDLDRKVWWEPFETESGDAVQGLFSPDGRTLIVADRKGRIVFWNLDEHRQLGVLTITNAPNGPGVLRFSNDGRWLVNPGGQEPTQIWSVEKRTLVKELREATTVDRAVFSPDGRWLATAGGDATVRLWETAGWQKARTLRGHTDPITAVDFSPDGRFLATGARNGEVKVWAMEEPSAAPEEVTFAPPQHFRVASDGSGFGRIVESELIRGVKVWTAEVWSAAPLQRIFTVPLPAGSPSSGAVLPGSRGLVLGGYAGSIRIVGPLVGPGIVVTNAHQGEVYLMDVSLDGSTLATKGMKDAVMPEDRIRIWRLPGLEPIGELSHAESVHGIKLSDDGKLLAGFTGRGDVGVWDIPSMQGPPMWRGIRALQIVSVCAFTPDHRRLAAATPDGGAFVWDLATHRRLELPRALTEYTSLSFSPDGSRLAAGSKGEGKLFDTATGQVVLSFQERGLMLAFARDGESLLAVRGEGATVFHAPSVEQLQFAWLKPPPPPETPAYLGPNSHYARPDRPPSAGEDR